MESAVCPCYFHELAVAGACARISEMSRRSRKRRAAGENRWLGKAAVGLLVLGVDRAGRGLRD